MPNVQCSRLTSCVITFIFEILMEFGCVHVILNAKFYWRVFFAKLSTFRSQSIQRVALVGATRSLWRWFLQFNMVSSFNIQICELIEWNDCTMAALLWRFQMTKPNKFMNKFRCEFRSPTAEQSEIKVFLYCNTQWRGDTNVKFIVMCRLCCCFLLRERSIRVDPNLQDYIVKLVVF